MSVRKEIHNLISAKLETLDLYHWIDMYKGQMNNKESYPTGFPCAFVSIGSIKYEDMTLGIKEGNLILDIYIFFEKGGDTFNSAADKENSLTILDTVDETIEELENFKGGLFTELSQNGEEDLTERYKRPAFKISFEATIYKRMKNNDYVLN